MVCAEAAKAGVAAAATNCRRFISILREYQNCAGLRRGTRQRSPARPWLPRLHCPDRDPALCRRARRCRRMRCPLGHSRIPQRICTSVSAIPRSRLPPGSCKTRSTSKVTSILSFPTELADTGNRSIRAESQLVISTAGLGLPSTETVSRIGPRATWLAAQRPLTRTVWSLELGPWMNSEAACGIHRKPLSA